MWPASLVEGGRRTLDTIEHYGIATLMVIVGPISLGLAMAYGVIHSRNRSRATRQQSESATKSLYTAAADQERRAADQERRNEGQDPGPLPR
jgi:hypothetical protein